MKSLAVRVQALLLVGATCLAAAETYRQQVSLFYATAHGLPSTDVLAVVRTPPGVVYAATTSGLARYAQGAWRRVESFPGRVEALAADGDGLLVAFQGLLWRLRDDKAQRLAALPPGVKVGCLSPGPPVLVGADNGLYELAGNRLRPVSALLPLLGGKGEIRQVAVAPDGRVAVAAEAGLFLRDSRGRWSRLFPRQGSRSWAAEDAWGVAFDARGRLWFACPQGAGRLDTEWTLYTGEDGLPYDDFTTVAAGEPGVVWFGTRRGAIRFDGTHWEYRQGRRWLPEDEVRSIAVAPEGHAWIGTPQGVACIELRPMSLRQKAAYFEQEIDKRHRRTPFGYVDSVRLKRPGDTSEWIQRDSDNDGLWTGMYGAGECFAWAATRDPAG